jgi:muramoyltetrapeptide carboxypeptidase
MKVRIIAPSSKCIDSTIKLNQAIELLTSHGFEVSHSEHLFSNTTLPYYANDALHRLEDLRDAILSDDDIIWAFRGGYGAGEIVEDCLDLKSELPKKKTLIGFSDITAIHLLFNQTFNMPSLHASVLTSLLGDQSHHIDDIKKILFGEKNILRLTPANELAKSARVEGKIIGGNLCVLQTMIGTKLHPNTDDKIILIEDVAEPGYKIARILNHFKNAGLFNSLKGIILGDFTNEAENHYIDETLESFINANPNIPIYRLNSGHGHINHPVILGSNIVIENSFLEGAL